jgi:hypothetical protein
MLVKRELLFDTSKYKAKKPLVSLHLQEKQAAFFTFNGKLKIFKEIFNLLSPKSISQ